MYHLVSDTIVAISSAPGPGPRGIVRLSGPQAIALADDLCTISGGTRLAAAAGSTALLGRLALDDLRAAPVIVYLFRGPRSYTRQDLVELHTVGSPPLLAMVVERCLERGARAAQPGEFTARAYLSGALRLTEAEGVAAAISARTDAQLRSARRLLSGELALRCTAWQEELTAVLALVVADIDFAEEAIEFISPADLSSRLDRLIAELDGLLAAAQSRRQVNPLHHVLLLGPPNAGKSTLCNRLCGCDRALVSAVAGTTRDLLSAVARLPGGEVVLLDSAGLDENPDEVLARGRELAKSAAATVDLVCVVVDAAAPDAADMSRTIAGPLVTPIVIAANKVDKLSIAERGACAAELAGAAGPVCLISARSGEGVDELRAAVSRALGDPAGGAEDDIILLNARQSAALGETCQALRSCRDTARAAAAVLDAAELLAVDLREALDALAAVNPDAPAAGTEELLGRIFATFCIGK